MRILICVAAVTAALAGIGAPRRRTIPPGRYNDRAVSCRRGSVMETIAALLIGFVCGYAVHELISRRPRAEYRRRHPERYSSYTKEGP